MSKLERLRISGIRSFGPYDTDAQEIKFRTPLILILGQNGCGKTTIIESLKFAITGELPGGSKSGQGFLYDPKMHDGYETRGQVKLKVNNVRGEKITVQKTMIVTKKSNRLEFKRLDSTISKGNGQQISGKTGEIDQQMCEALGVSKAILNNVIFCHQEDSNWPLGEGRKVKERFDEIFDATKYNKCLADILKIRKIENEKLKILKIEVNVLEERKKEMDLVKEDLGEKEEKLGVFNQTIEQLREKVKPIEKQLRHIENIETNFTKLYSEVESKKNDQKNLMERKRELQQAIKEEFTGTDAELEEKISEFKTDLQKIIAEKSKLENDVTDIENLETNLHQDVSNKQRLLGIMQAKQIQNQNHKSQLAEHIVAITGQLELDKPSTSELTTNEASEFIEIIMKKIQEMNEVFKDLENQYDNKNKKGETEVNECRDEFTKLNEKIVLKNQQLLDLKNEIDQIDAKLKDISSYNKQLSFLENRIQRLDYECNSFLSSYDVSFLKDEIEIENKKYDQVGNDLSKINSEIQMLQSYSSLQTDLDIKNDDLFKLQFELRNMKSKHEKSFRKVFSDFLPTDSMLKSSLDTYQKTNMVTLKEYNAEVIKTQKELTKIETNLHVLKDKLNSVEKEIENGKMQLQRNCGDESYDNAIAEVRKTVDKLQKDKGTYSSSKYLFQKFIEQFQKVNPCCPLCKTKFEEKLAIKKIIDDLNTKIQDFPTKLQQTEEKLQVWEKKYKTLLELRPVHDKIDQLNQEVPKLQLKIADLEKEHSEKKREIENLRTSLNELQQNLDLINNLTSEVSLIDKLHKDEIKYQNDVDTLTLKIPKRYASTNIQEVLAQQETLNTEYTTIRNHIDSLRNKLTQHTERLQNFKEQRSEFTNKQLEIKAKIQSQDQLNLQHDDTELKLSVVIDELNELTSSVSLVKQKLEALVTQKEQQKTENKNKLDESRNKMSTIQKILDQIVTLEHNIDIFEKSSAVSKINEIEETLENCKEQLNKHSEQKSIITSNLNQLEQQIANSNNRFRDLQDNVQLREKIKSMKTLTIELEKLGKELGETDITRKRAEKEQLTRDMTQIITEKSRIEGKIIELKEIVIDLKKKLARPDNTSAASDYKKKFVELLVKQIAIEDLGNFAKSVEWSIVQFHKQRMVQINKIIRDLWRSIYRGNDCDYIEIKTEMGDSGNIERRRVYNYYVVQVKNDIELEMRGRCSAGQKVLASLIIRIALAETFSNNCGILALDEPTTNLDRENVSSLSQALVEIIVQKRQTKNFQLLVITHDEEFLSNVTQAGGLYTFYIISRNAEGKSQITEKKE